MSYDLWGRLGYMLSPQFDIYEQVAKKVFGKVIDVGCGTGFGTHILTRNADFVLGLDIEEAAIRFAKRSFSNCKIKFDDFDITASYTYEPYPYDFIVMIDVIEHIENDSEAIRNCTKLLKNAGTFICSTPNRLSRYRKSEYHVREYSPNELRILMALVFNEVDIVNYHLKTIESEYENTIIAICS